MTILRPADAVPSQHGPARCRTHARYGSSPAEPIAQMMSMFSAASARPSWLVPHRRSPTLERNRPYYTHGNTSSEPILLHAHRHRGHGAPRNPAMLACKYRRSRHSAQGSRPRSPALRCRPTRAPFTARDHPGALCVSTHTRTHRVLRSVLLLASAISLSVVMTGHASRTSDATAMCAQRYAYGELHCQCHSPEAFEIIRETDTVNRGSNHKPKDYKHIIRSWDLYELR